MFSAMASIGAMVSAWALLTGWLKNFTKDERPMAHLFIPPWTANQSVSAWNVASAGVQWRPGPNILSFGLDPATATHSMLESMDFVLANQGQLHLRLNFTSGIDKLKHRMTVLQQSTEYGKARPNPKAEESLKQLTYFHHQGYRTTETNFPMTLPMLVPVHEPLQMEHALAEYLDRQVAHESVKVAFGGPPSTDQLNAPNGLAFHEGNLYISDSKNHRIVKVKPGESEGEIFFGGKGRGSNLDQLNAPNGLAFHEGNLYISDSKNHRIVKVKPGESEGEIFFGGKGRGSNLDQLKRPSHLYISGLAFHEGNLYISDSDNHRIVKVKPGESEGEVFFGGKGPGSNRNQLNAPNGLAFHEGSLYISDSDLQQPHREGEARRV